MSEGKEGTEKSRQHLNSDELPGRQFDVQGQDDGQGNDVKKKSRFAGFIATWVPIASQRLSTARHRLFPPKR